MGRAVCPAPEPPDSGGAGRLYRGGADFPNALTVAGMENAP